MFTFTAKNLHRALDVAAMPAFKATADARLPLHHVHAQFTDQGLILTGTERHHLVRTLAEYDGDAPEHGQGAPVVMIHRDGVKRALAMLKAAKLAPATVEADAETVTVTVEGQSLRLENAARDGGDFPRVDSILRLHQNTHRPVNAEPFVALNPGFLHDITTLAKRHAERHAPLHLSLDRVIAGKPVCWMLGDWALGILMPIRDEDGPRTREHEAGQENGGLERLLTAVPLMEAPETAAVREDSPEVTAARATTHAAPATA